MARCLDAVLADWLAAPASPSGSHPSTNPALSLLPLVQCALRFAEAWACLIARKRLTPTAARSAAVMAAVDSHALTLQQLRRADAVLRLLPGVQTH